MPASSRLRLPPAAWRSAGRVAVLIVCWLVLSLAAAALILPHSSKTTTFASHDAVVQPNLQGMVVLHAGALLPDLRVHADGPVGADVYLGTTEARSLEQLLERYALIASQPAGQVAKLQHTVRELIVAALLRGAAVGAVPIIFWLLMGRDRRREVFGPIRHPRVLVPGVALAVGTLLVWQPWVRPGTTLDESSPWQRLPDFLGPETPLPDAVAGVEIRVTGGTESTKRLILSAVDTYRTSEEFYGRAADAAGGLPLHRRAADETVAVLVSDRHDNVGMDAVAAAIADAGGATVVLDAGDDTSAGRPWEAFSLDSLDEAFDGFDRFAVTGNHDHGSFVGDYLADLGWTRPAGEVIAGPGGSSLLGVDDPRASGWGNWRDQGTVSFADLGDQLADTACAYSDPVGTMLVHDANLGKAALERGCVDLVVGGHLHVVKGPTKVIGDNSSVGYTYTNGTTGGAAYAIAVGSKPRRTATLTLITYRDARPVGVQTVTLETDGTLSAGDYTPLSPR